VLDPEEDTPDAQDRRWRPMGAARLDAASGTVEWETADGEAGRWQLQVSGGAEGDDDRASVWVAWGGRGELDAATYSEEWGCASLMQHVVPKPYSQAPSVTP
jgi:hypothetical protein